MSRTVDGAKGSASFTANRINRLWSWRQECLGPGSHLLHRSWRQGLSPSCLPSPTNQLLQSLSLSRSSSTRSLRSSHRRSHPNLTHLSLAPLTPKFPISSSDYDAFISPDTSALHTSTSYLATSSTPTTPPLLTRSRNASSTRLAKSKSSLAVSSSRSQFAGAVSSSGLGGRIRSGLQLRPINTKAAARHKRVDSEWMLRAGLILADSSRESKGQTWLNKRESSTSLASISAEEEGGLSEYDTGALGGFDRASGRATPKSTLATPLRSRRGSRRGAEPIC